MNFRIFLTFFWIIKCQTSVHENHFIKTISNKSKMDLIINRSLFILARKNSINLKTHTMN